MHFQPPLLLSEYVQEIGRAGRDGEVSEALLLMSEPTGFLDSGDKQRREFFEGKMRSQQRQAQQLLNKLPKQGNINEISRKFPEAAIALSLLHSMNKLSWLDPFNYIIKFGEKSQTSNQFDAAKQMEKYLRSRQCRWQFLLKAFGFSQEAEKMKCGHCDNCRKRGVGTGD